MENLTRQAFNAEQQVFFDAFLGVDKKGAVVSADEM